MLLMKKNTPRATRAKHSMTKAVPGGRVRQAKTINSIEIGKYVPSTLLALKIAAVFNTGVNDIFTLEDEDWD